MPRHLALGRAATQGIGTGGAVCGGHARVHGSSCLGEAPFTAPGKESSVSGNMDGPDRVCYRISGRLPDGKTVRLEVPGVGVARWLPDTEAEPVLPAAARRRLRRALPSFRPEAGTVHVTRQAGAVWFALDGRLADGRRAHLVISPDGRSLSLTVADARSGLPPGAGTHVLSG